MTFGLLELLCIKFKIRIQGSLQQRCSLSYVWGLTFYSQIENNCMTASLHYFKTSWTLYLFFKCLHRAKKVSNHVSICVMILSVSNDFRLDFGTINKLCRGYSNKHSSRYWLQLAQWLQKTKMHKLIGHDYRPKT